MPLNETSHAWHHSDEQLVGTILNRITAHAENAGFSRNRYEQQAREIVAYVKSLWSDRILAVKARSI